MSAKIEYNGSTVATIPDGKVATLPVKDMQMKTDIKVKVDYGGEAPSSPAIETGTLTLYDGNGYNFEIIYPQYRADGSIISVQETYNGDGDGDAIFNNIPLGAPVVMYFPGRDGIDDGDLQGLSEINFSSYLPSCRVFKLTASAAAAYFL